MKNKNCTKSHFEVIKLKKFKKIVLLVMMVLFSFTISNVNFFASQNEEKVYEEAPNLSNWPYKKSLIVGTDSGPGNIEPLHAWDTSSIDVIRQTLEGLYMINYSDPDLGRMPVLALDDGVWEDNKTWTVTLRQNVLFHDGTKFNATAVKWNIDRLNYHLNASGTNPNNGSQSSTATLYMFDSTTPIIKNVTINNEYNITIHLNGPFSPLLNLLGFSASYFLSPASTPFGQHLDTITSDIVGTGAFVFDNYTEDTEVRFHRWSQYWRTPTQIENLTISIIEDDTLRNNAMLNGSIDILLGETKSLLPSFRADPNIMVHDTGPGFAYFYLGMNNKQINVTFREAISYAFNYSYVIEELMEGHATRAYSPLTADWPQLAGWNQTTELNTPVFNVTYARKILVDAGISNLNWTVDTGWTAANYATFNYSYNTDNQFRSDLYPMLRDNLDQIGIVVTDAGMTRQDFISTYFGLSPGGYDRLQLFWVGWGPDYMDPWNMLDPLFNNASASNTAQVNDSLIQTMLTTALDETDDDKKTNIIKQILGNLTGRIYPHVFGYHPYIYDIHNIRLKGYPNNTINNLYIYPCYWDLINYSIELSEPLDYSHYEGAIGNYISWTVTAENVSSALYYIYIDSVFDTSATWTPGSDIVFNTGGLSGGTHEVHIELHYDGYIWEDFVIVTINYNDYSIVISSPSDYTYKEGSTGHNITWTVTALQNISNPSYSLYIDSSTPITGSWTSGVPIVINIDDLLNATYQYRIEASNGNETIEDTVVVKVMKDTIGGGGFPFDILIIIGVILIVIGSVLGLAVVRKKRHSRMAYQVASIIPDKEEIIEDIKGKASKIGQVLEFMMNVGEAITTGDIVKGLHFTIDEADEYLKTLDSSVGYKKSEIEEIKRKAEEALQQFAEPTLYDLVVKLGFDHVMAMKVGKYLTKTGLLSKFNKIQVKEPELKHKFEPSPVPIESMDLEIKRGGDWDVEGNQSIFKYKVKVHNSSEVILTNIQIILTSIPRSLEVESELYKIDHLRPYAYESPVFKLKARESCVGDVIEGVITYMDPFGKQHMETIEPLKIEYVCNLLTPKQVTETEYKRKTASMDKREITIESDLAPEKLEIELASILESNNFFLLDKTPEPTESKVREIKGYAEGKYDKEDVGLSVVMQQMPDQSTNLVFKAMSEREEKLIDLLRDINVKCDDIKSCNELILEYSMKIEQVIDQIDNLEDFLIRHLGKDFEQIKHVWSKFKTGQIGKKGLIAEGAKILGKRFLKLFIGRMS